MQVSLTSASSGCPVFATPLQQPAINRRWRNRAEPISHLAREVPWYPRGRLLAGQAGLLPKFHDGCQSALDTLDRWRVRPPVRDGHWSQHRGGDRPLRQCGELLNRRTSGSDSMPRSRKSDTTSDRASCAASRSASAGSSPRSIRSRRWFSNSLIFSLSKRNAASLCGCFATISTRIPWPPRSRRPRFRRPTGIRHH